jgi:ankyrin repeat protein
MGSYPDRRSEEATGKMYRGDISRLQEVQSMTQHSEDLLSELERFLGGSDESAACSLIRSTPGIAQLSDEFGTTALLVACKFAALSTTTLLCDLKSDVNARAQTGESPLVNVIHGARFGMARDAVECMRLLLQRGADPNVLVYDGCNALHQAIIHSQVDLVRELLEHEADPSIRLDDWPNQEDAMELASSERPQGTEEQRLKIIKLLSNARPAKPSA